MAAVGLFSFVLNNYTVHFVHFNMETKVVDTAKRKK